MCVSYSGLGHGALDYSEVRLYSHLFKHPTIDKSNIVPNLYVLHSSQIICCQSTCYRSTFCDQNPLKYVLMMFVIAFF